MNRNVSKRWLGVCALAAMLGTQPSRAQDTYDKDDADGRPAAMIGSTPSYPGLPRGQASKVETEIGPVKARFYGTILFNSSISDRAV